MLANLDSLGYVEMTQIQAQSLPVILKGLDLIAQAKTGSGKTAAFGIGLLNPINPRYFGCQALVMCPTRELADQVAKEIRRLARAEDNIKVLTLCGGVSLGPQIASLEHGAHVIVGTPGRIQQHLRKGSLVLDGLNTLILDEADRMLDMGFADDVQRLVGECVNRQQTMLFSATTGGSTLRDMVAKVLNNPEHLQVNNVSDLNETTRQQIVTADHNVHKEQILNWLLANETYQKAIVFTNTRAAADRIYGRLVAQEYKAFVLHGEKDQKDRKLAIDRLKAGGVKILVATDVAARGLDVDGLDLVINFDMPRSGDEYVHRIGRTGRAGNDGLAISLICHGDWNLMSSIERYLKQSFERRTIKEVKGTYTGPKKVKASGKAVGVKKKKTDAKGDKKKTGAKSPTKRKIANRPKTDNLSLVSKDGMAPLKRRKPEAPAAE
ncbi:DEAD/DEAH box helicase [Pseudomonas sp. P7548]|uniref:DEAD/DEAH box helicase n=1 Tax=Pseudomonas sp. P7548 TaxID=2726981 RepID=UPI0015BFE9FC|nr:DEAD/DEAH box helicase [Pseudomonas sp. P7548]NWE19086.1 DEAD/DEAH box helicase [Pseudomonas sp. P7548]